MKLGAGISGGAHLGLIGLLIFSGELFSESAAQPVAIAEVTLMTGTEFAAATSAAPEFNPDLPAAPETPNPDAERADVNLSETDAAPTTEVNPNHPEEPERGEVVDAPDEQPASASIANVGEQPAAPLAPEDDVIVAASEPTDVIAPVADRPLSPAPAPAPRAAPQLEDTTPEAETPPERAPLPIPQPQPTPEPEPVEADSAPEPVTTPEVAEAPTQPAPVETPVVEVEPEKLNDPEIPAPKLAPPPPTKPREIAEAKEAERLAREAVQPAETGATRQAEAPSGQGATQTVGRLSFREKDSLRVGIKNFFSPPDRLRTERELYVVLQISVSQDGKITAGPRRVGGGGGSESFIKLLERAGTNALKKASLSGVFARLPKDRYQRWKVMRVTFKPTEIEFL